MTLSPIRRPQMPACNAVIEQINRQPVNSVGDYQRLVGQNGNQAIVLLVNRQGSTTFIVVNRNSS